MTTTTDRTRLDWAIHDNARAIDNNAKALKAAAQSLIEKMESVVRHVDEGMTINSLGEVQGRGFEVDRLCALRAQLFDFRNTLEGVEAQ